jgi:hypothetical protein
MTAPQATNTPARSSREGTANSEGTKVSPSNLMCAVQPAMMETVAAIETTATGIKSAVQTVRPKAL